MVRDPYTPEAITDEDRPNWMRTQPPLDKLSVYDQPANVLLQVDLVGQEKIDYDKVDGYESQSAVK